MLSDNRELIRKVINTYPEVFESLLEFERTKKIPKLYRRKRINLTIDENILREFKAYSRKNNINMSRFIEEKMLNALKDRKSSGN
ncbi:hypothetical protein J4410_06790 [Candidatus Woesearchaeota archaeon]|nr:hypothetical protein [Candidatus Woesearchaeota archaeon]